MRSLPDPGFAGDDGSPDPRLATALAGYRHAAGSGGWAAAERAVLGALSGARLLVAVVAIPAGEPTGDVPPEGEKRTDMALVTLRSRDGSTGLPVFTSAVALVGWDRKARPVPVSTERACLAALAEGAESLLVDPVRGGPPGYVLTNPALREFAHGRTPLHPLEDPQVTAAVRAAARDETALERVRLLPGRDSEVTVADVTVAMVLREGVGVGQGKAAARRVAARLAEDPVIRERLRHGLDLAVLPAGSTLD